MAEMTDEEVAQEVAELTEEYTEEEERAVTELLLDSLLEAETELQRRITDDPTAGPGQTTPALTNISAMIAVVQLALSES